MFRVTNVDQEQLVTNPSLFLENKIKQYVANSPNNRLTAFPGERIWDEPLVGFADGDDSIFQEYKEIIGDFHLTPREALEKHHQLRGKVNYRQPNNVSVISWILPSTHQTRLSLRSETTVPSLRWNHTRWQGQDFIFELSRHLVSLLEGLGHLAFAPELLEYFKMVNLSNGLASN